MSRVRQRGSTRTPKADERERLIQQLRETRARHEEGQPREICLIVMAGYEWFGSQSHDFKQSYVKWVRSSDPIDKDVRWQAMLAEHRDFQRLPPDTHEQQGKQPWGSPSAGEELSALAILSMVTDEQRATGMSHALACDRVTAKMGLVNPDLGDPFEAGRQRIFRLRKSYASSIAALSSELEFKGFLFEGLNRAQVRIDCLGYRLIRAMGEFACARGPAGIVKARDLARRIGEKAKRRRHLRRRSSHIRPQGNLRHACVMNLQIGDIRSRWAAAIAARSAAVAVRTTASGHQRPRSVGTGKGLVGAQ